MNPFRRFTLWLLGWYRSYRSLQPPSCRFTPTCSHYATEAIESHGVVRGGWLTARRLARCHPFGGHGHDPVPTPRNTLTHHHA